MLVYALDLAVCSGFAFGRPGETPRSGVVRLKQSDEPPAVAYSNLIAYLNTALAEVPDIVVKEAPIPLQGFRNLGNAAATVRLTHGLHAIVEGMCVRFGIRCEEAAAATIRKHFIGCAQAGDRRATKRAVIDRCHLLKLMPSTSVDDNRADAIATWDFACATYARRPIDARELRMFRDIAEVPFS